MVAFFSSARFTACSSLYDLLRAALMSVVELCLSRPRHENSTVMQMSQGAVGFAAACLFMSYAWLGLLLLHIVLCVSIAL